MIINNKSSVPKYFQLQTWLQDRIEQGYYGTNEKIPTENELVKLSGLSRATVPQALKNLENDGYIIRKKRVGSFVQKTRKQTKSCCVTLYKTDFTKAVSRINTKAT